MFGYFSFEGFENELQEEISFLTGKKATRYGRLFIFDVPLELVWAQLVLKDIQIAQIESISKAAQLLKSKNRIWAPYAFHLHRRTELIQDQIRTPKQKKYNFLEPHAERDWGFWCLLSEDKILYSSCTGKSDPLGSFKFHEDKDSPPSRAYLKLWEIFSVHVKPPEERSRVLDLGSCPGGWTWVLQTLGCHVISVDTAPLDAQVAKLKGVEFIKKDAFRLDPRTVEKPEWLFSDIICDPSRLYDLVQSWSRVHSNLNFICTIKYKGKTDFKTTELFKNIPGSRLIHLLHNKHEVTWICLKKK